MPKRAAEDPLEKVMDMMDDRKKLLGDGQYLKLCSIMKRLHDAKEKLDDTVHEAEDLVARANIQLQRVTATGTFNFRDPALKEILLEHVESTRQMLKNFQASARMARADRRSQKKIRDEALTDIAQMFDTLTRACAVGALMKLKKSKLVELCATCPVQLRASGTKQEIAEAVIALIHTKCPETLRQLVDDWCNESE